MSSAVVISLTSSTSIDSPTTSPSTSSIPLPSSSFVSSSDLGSSTTNSLGFSIITISTTVNPPPTQTSSSSTNETTQNNSRLNPGTLAGVVIGGLLAGVVIGGCIWLLIILIRRRMRPRKPAVESQPEERLMHLEKMRGQAAPPLRDDLAIQSLPPSRNIRVINWIARTRGAGPPSISQQTVMSERSVHEENRRDVPLPDDLLSDSSSESRYSCPSTIPRRPEPQKSSSEIVERPSVSDSPSFIKMD